MKYIIKYFDREGNPENISRMPANYDTRAIFQKGNLIKLQDSGAEYEIKNVMAILEEGELIETIVYAREIDWIK